MSNETDRFGTDGKPADGAPPHEDAAPEFDGIDVAEDREEVAVRVKNKDGSVDRYKLVEMDGRALGRWTNLSRVRSKRTDANAFDGFQAQCLALCLRTPDGQPVGEDRIARIAAGGQMRLFLKAQQMNGLDPDAGK